MGKDERIKPEGFIFHDKTKIQAFRDMKPCGLVNSRRRFKDSHSLHIQYLSSTVWVDCLEGHFEDLPNLSSGSNQVA